MGLLGARIRHASTPSAGPSTPMANASIGIRYRQIAESVANEIIEERVTVTIIEGKLALAPWQSGRFVDYDGPRGGGYW